MDVETAAPLAEQLGLEPEIVEGFAELDKQSQAYIPVEDLQDERHKHILEKMRNRDWAGLGYQDPDEFRKEVIAAQLDLLERHHNKRIAIVSHGGTINAIVASVLDMPQMFFFQPGYTSISRVVKSEWNDKWVVRSLNEEAHSTPSPTPSNPSDLRYSDKLPLMLILPVTGSTEPSPRMSRLMTVHNSI